MSDLAIRVQGLGKRYRLGARQRTYRDFREHIVEAVKLPYRRLRSALAGGSTILSDESIWALKDVSFDVEEGEVVGVIGRNGAGKTTLLKVLSRITEPTEGRAEIHGRVASLLEVGTGFHPELTGRENVYLNGAILGMGRSEIDRKFDEIVAFAEVERFLDTQVKHYSSGMYLRLAFAVAAHLEPEILLVDEVLAVGDASFQRRCLGKMSDVARSGRTVLFVSHNMEAVERLCPRSLWIDDGRVAEEGATEDVISSYLAATRPPVETSYRGPRSSSDPSYLVKADFLDSTGRPCDALRFGEPFSIRMVWQNRSSIGGAFYFIEVKDARGRIISATNHRDDELGIEGPGRHEVVCQVESNVLIPGDYSLSIGCFQAPKTFFHRAEDCLRLEVSELPYDLRFRRPPQGVLIALPSVWQRRSEP